jgi:hypothetical protein
MRGRRHKLQVSTFPFLAVLLCAMGSLILILLVMDRKAHRAALNRAYQQATKLAAETARGEAERESIRKQAREEQEKKREEQHVKLMEQQIELQLQMRKVREQLQQIAARLHYEQDTGTELRRKLKDERSRLQEDEQLLMALRSRAQQSENQTKESNQTLHRMTIDLLRMEQVLKDLKTSKQREQKTFSVVPYHGRRGENQRPIYVECGADGVVFHPERKAMSVVSLWSGSPDSPNEVRTEVERRIAKQRAKLARLPGNEERKPYLLLLVRPAGVSTYYRFQRALVGLDLKFGYEFIDDDWVLDFPVDDEMPNAQPWRTTVKTPTPAAPSVAQNSPSTPLPHPASISRGGMSSGSANGFRGFPGVPGSGNVASGEQIASSMSANSPGGEGNSASGSQLGGSRVGGARGSFASSSVAQAGSIGGFGGGGGFGTTSGIGNANGSGQGSPPQSGSGFSASPADSSPSQGSGERSLFPQMGRQGSAGQGSGAVASSMTGGNGLGHPSAMPPSGGYGGDGSGTAGGYASGGGDYRGMSQGTSAGSGVGFGSDAPMGGTGGTGGTGGSAWSGVGVATGSSSGSFGGYPSGGGGYRGMSQGTSAGSGTGVGFASDAPMGGMGGTGGSAGSGVGGATGSSSGSFGGGGGNGVPGSAAFGNGMRGSGGSGSGMIGNGANGNGGSSGGMVGNGTPNGGAMASGGIGSPAGGGSGQAGSMGMVGNGGGFNPGSSGSLGGGEGSARLAPPTGLTDNANPNGGGSISGVQGTPGEPSQIATTANGATPNGATPNGASPNGATPNGATPNGGSAGVIFIDPLTGKRVTPPPPPSQSDAPPPPDEPAGNRGPPRVRFYHGMNNSKQGAEGDTEGGQNDGLNGMLPPPPARNVPHRPIVTRPAWIHGGRDWTIFIECRKEVLVLYPEQRAFPLAEVVRAPAENPLIKAIQKMIDRRQSGRRPGEPPYHPQLCLLVRPEHIRTFLSIYPALEALPIPKTRRNVDAGDDVIDIVTGAIP